MNTSKEISQKLQCAKFAFCRSGLAPSTMSEEFSTPSWDLLPLELLGQIFSFVPKHMLNNIGLVCSSWKDAVHCSAVKLLMSCISAGQLEEKQIERFGWRTSAAWDHDNEKCSCIDLAFNFFSGKSSVLAQGFSRKCLDTYLRMPATTMSDKVIYMDVDEHDKVLLRVIDRLDAGSQPQILELPIEQEDDYVLHWKNTQIVACDNLLAVSIRQASGILKVFLWNIESETWLADLDITHFIPNSNVQCFTITRNLLAVTAQSDNESNDSFFWRLDTRHPDAFLPQFLGKVIDRPGNGVSVIMNDKWIVLCYSDGIRSIERTRLFCGDQDHVAVEAQQVNPELPHPWQLVKLNDMDYSSVSATLEPGSSNRLAVPLDDYTIFHILNLATGETVCRVDLGSNLHPVSWCAGNFLLIKELELNSDSGKRLQVVVFDPSRSRGSNSVAELEKEEACLLSGPTVSYFGDIDISIEYLQTMTPIVHIIDYLGFVLAVFPILSIASFD